MKRLFCLLLALLLLSSVFFVQAEEEMPEEVQRMLDIALGEMEELQKEAIPRTNKYSRWYFHDERRIGWCVTFVGWCADEAGLPMVKEADSAAGIVPEGELFFPLEAKVILASRAFEWAGRLVEVPKPGYAVVYGVIGGTPATHFALVESVREIEENVYEITTIEGNVSDTVKRYCYRYTTAPKRKHHNMSVVPEEERVVEDAQYKLQKDTWYIVGFGQTYGEAQNPPVTPPEK